MTIGRYRAGRKPAHLHESFSRAFPRSLTPCAFPCEATAVWQWSNHSRSRTQAGRQTLCINIDETAICLFQGHGKGNLFCSKKTQNVSRWVQRVHLTLVAFLCEDAALQSKMPQIYRKRVAWSLELSGWARGVTTPAAQDVKCPAQLISHKRGGRIAGGNPPATDGSLNKPKSKAGAHDERARAIRNVNP